MGLLGLHANWFTQSVHIQGSGLTQWWWPDAGAGAPSAPTGAGAEQCSWPMSTRPSMMVPNANGMSLLNTAATLTGASVSSLSCTTSLLCPGLRNVQLMKPCNMISYETLDR